MNTYKERSPEEQRKADKGESRGGANEAVMPPNPITRKPMRPMTKPARKGRK